MSRFLYRGKIYQIEQSGVNAKFVLLYPLKRVLVVSRWGNDIPTHFDDIRTLPTNMTVQEFLLQGKGKATLAEEIDPLPGEIAEPYAVIDINGQRYAFPTYWKQGVTDSYVDVDGKIYRVESWDVSERHVHDSRLVDEIKPGSYDEHALNTWIPTKTRAVLSNLPGLNRDGYDNRIHLSWEGRDYLLSSEAYHEGKKIFIPGVGFFAVDGWLESMPVQPDGLHQISESRKGDLRDYIVAIPIEEAPDYSHYPYGGEEE